MSKPAFGEIGDEEASVVHRERDAHLGFDLAQNVANHGIQEELADFVLDRGDGLTLETRVISGIFLRPKRPNERVFDLPDDPGPVRFVGEHPVDAQKRGVGTIQKRRHRVIQNVFKSRPP